MEWEAIVGANVRRLRKERGLTQEALAAKTGKTVRYVAGVERGQENPSIRTLAMIAAALGVGPADLLAAVVQTDAG